MGQLVLPDWAPRTGRRAGGLRIPDVPRKSNPPLISNLETDELLDYQQCEEVPNPAIAVPRAMLVSDCAQLRQSQQLIRWLYATDDSNRRRGHGNHLNFRYTLYHA